MNETVCFVVSSSQAHEIIQSCDPEGKSKLLVDDAVFKILLRKLR